MNDNDLSGPRFVPNYEIIVGEDGDVLTDLSSFDPREYQEIRYRKARQLKGILKRSGDNEKIKDAASAQDTEEKEV